MPPKARVGLVGTGGIANAHIQAFLSVMDVVITGLWNRTRARAEQIADKYELKDAVVYDSWEAMLDEADLDIVSVVTAPQLRAKPVIASLKGGKHVLVEKPYATTVEEALSMTEAANDSTCVTAVNFCHRYRQENLIARRIVSEGILGGITNYNDTWR
jgi:D-apiose dehydrogenase